jgi:hypothetical protein
MSEIAMIFSIVVLGGMTVASLVMAYKVLDTDKKYDDDE